MAAYISLPAPLRQFFALFPLHTHPAVSSPYTAEKITAPTLWVLPPRDPEADLLSSDVECLKWQAYLALRGLTDIGVRWDVSEDGSLESRLPNLHVPQKENDDGGGQLLAPHLIPEWVDTRVGGGPGELEGYISEAARDESRAWVALMEGKVHAALVIMSRLLRTSIGSLVRPCLQILSQPHYPSFLSFLAPFPSKPRPIEASLNPPPAPLTGLSALLPPFGAHFDRLAIELQYKDAIAALSERLGTDRWFLGSSYVLPLSYKLSYSKRRSSINQRTNGT